MTRLKRNSLISNLSENQDDKLVMYRISDLIGDDDEIILDYDDLSEVTCIDDYAEIEDYLQIMFALEILSIYDEENAIMG